MKKYCPIVWGVVICLIVGAVSRMTHETAMDVWYPFLKKSPLNPPDIVFPIVWGILYVLMGISVGIIYNSDKSPARSRMLWVFGIQLALNYVWNLFFFYMQSPTWGLVIMPVLVGMAIWYFWDAWHVRRASAWLFLPYVLWMCFATYLNLYIVLNN